MTTTTDPLPVVIIDKRDMPKSNRWKGESLGKRLDRPHHPDGWFTR